MLTAKQKSTLIRMTKVRSDILKDYPFYGRLLMNLKFATAPCGTACTDMEHIAFDPEFAEAITDSEMSFVMMHEVMHCALKHCLRGREYNNKLFNIACDIVVNSNILLALEKTEFKVDGENAMHIAPDGREGYMCTAEEVYRMLMESELEVQGEPDQEGSEAQGGASGITEGQLDNHKTWENVSEETTMLSEKWDLAVKEAVNKGMKGSSNIQIPPALLDYVLKLENTAKVDWRKVLQEFIQLHCDRYDYSFTPADRRFTAYDYIIPSFSETEDEVLRNLWFCVDTSGSISPETLSDIMTEILQAILMFKNLSGRISFFDTAITEPVEFESADDFKKVKPIGGGGTSFRVIFDYMKAHMQEDPPVAIIVLTDGYCEYPKADAAMDVPVLWIIYDNPADAPWGKTVHVKTEGLEEY